jgi:hypothetical protein
MYSVQICKLFAAELVLQCWKMIHWFLAGIRKIIHECENIKLEFLDVMVFCKENLFFY